MKQSLTVLLALLTSQLVVATENQFKEPILLTSCGQSADVLMMKTLLARDSLVFEYLPAATAADVENMGTLLIVLGGSSKGLGAAKISEADETARVMELVTAAEEDEVPVLAAHIGGMNRRGPLSDPFNKLGAEHATRILVVKGGNDDGFFTRIAEAKKIPLDSLNSALDAAPLLLQIYRPPNPSEETE